MQCYYLNDTSKVKRNRYILTSCTVSVKRTSEIVLTDKRRAANYEMYG